MAEAVPIFVQLPGHYDKQLAGEFTWDYTAAVGSFTYDQGYRVPASYLLDPIVLRARPRKEVRNKGVYGVFRDAGPDAWGRDQLMRLFGANLSEVGILLKAPEDGAGNITFHPEHRMRAYSLAEIDEVSAGFPPADTAVANAVNPTTSMGGAKPKLLAYDDGFFWIAKFPERGDPEYKNAANEHAMLVLAGHCGIDAAESKTHKLPDGRLILLVKRFDLAGTPDRFMRLGFASAHTVLGMGDPIHDGKLKSYPLLRFEAKRWITKDIGPDLWRRLAFNAIVANTDDHARNHALIYDGHWKLSKAFDIVAAPGEGPVRLCLKIQGDSVLATPTSLVLSADEMGVPREQAIDDLRFMAGVICERWRHEVGDGMQGWAIEQLAAAFRVAREVLDFDFASVPPPPSRRRRY